MLRIKVKSSEGEKVMNMNQDSTFYTLLQELGLENANFKAGFPVKSLNYSRDDLIKDYLKNGDSVLMEDCVKQFKELNPSEMPGYPQRGTLVNGDAIQTFEGILVVRPIKDDNSCLFRCIAQIMLNDNSDNVSRLRQVVVDNIRSHPELYSEAILGRPIDEYCDWILKPNSWGGAIEIGIFSNQFKTSIFACDATSGNIIRFGDYPNGCFVMYSGIHYDVISRSPGYNAGRDFDLFIFEESELEETRNDCQILVDLWKAQHKYTDVNQFTLKFRILTDV